VEHSDAVFDRVYFHTTSWGKYIALYAGKSEKVSHNRLRAGLRGNVKTYACTEVKVHMIVALKCSSSNYLSSVCLVGHGNISGAQFCVATKLLNL
jgi:hypothetical protein